MSIFDWLGNAVSNIGNALAKVIDSINAPAEQKADLKNQIETQLNDLKSKVIDSQLEMEKNITERLRIDMQSDSWLSKNIRPLTLIYIVAMFTIVSIPSMFNLNISSSYIDILKNWGELIFMFYFGGRSVEKISDIVRNKKK